MVASPPPPPITEAEARRAHRVLRAIWMIVSARHNDAVARDVAAMGEKLRDAIDAGDHAASAEAVEAVRVWLSTMAGVVTARLVHVFEIGGPTGDP